MNSFSIFISLLLFGIASYIAGKLIERLSSRQQLRIIRDEFMYDRQSLLATIKQLENTNRHLQRRLSILEQQIRATEP